MHRARFFLVIAVALQLAAAHVYAYTLWSHAKRGSYAPSGPGFTGGGQTSGFMVSAPFNSQFAVEFGFDVPSNVTVTGVTMCYQMTPPQKSYIDAVDLWSSMVNLPLIAHWDGGAEFWSGSAVCTTLAIPPMVPVAPLSFRIHVQVVNPDMMNIYAVGLEVQPGTLAAGEPEPRSGLSVGPSVPNPSSSRALIEYDAPAGEAVRLEIHDAAGRLIRTLDAGVRVPGVQRIGWDERDGSGRDVGPGVYFYRVVTPRATSEARRLTVIR